MNSKICTQCNIEKNIQFFLTNMQNVKIVILTEV